jgi:predicted nucleic acid-binding protein
VILVDTSVWIDFFRGTERAADLAEHLETNLVLLHPWVLGEPWAVSARDATQ